MTVLIDLSECRGLLFLLQSVEFSKIGNQMHPFFFFATAKDKDAVLESVPFALYPLQYLNVKFCVFSAITNFLSPSPA